MNELLAAMAEYGLNPGAFSLDGQLHKFKVESNDSKKSGWVIGWQHHTSAGEPFIVAEFGNYREGVRSKFKSNVKYSRDDSKVIKAKMAEASKREADNKIRINNEAAIEVEALWAELSDTGSSDYLSRKQLLNGDFGIKFNEETIYVPMRDINGKLRSVQKIEPDGSKRFYPGGRVSGCFHTLGSFNKSGLVYIAEGLATAASIRLATGQCVIVTFASNNLGIVAKSIRATAPECSIILCGDDDRHKGEGKNAGREAAEKAAKECLAGTAFPRFRNNESKPTDFNDLHCLEGLNAVKEQLDVAPPPKMAAYALGMDGHEFFFTSTHNRQLLGFSKLSEDSLLKLLPLQYWEACYPNENGKCDWVAAKSDLMDKARGRGIFKLHQVRGRGVWNDQGRVVVNMGDHLICDGRRLDLGEIKSKYFYSLGANLNILNDSPLSVLECSRFVETCNLFKWTKPDSGILLAGALVLSRICGSLPIRPHLWITGGAHTGKTTLLERLINPIMGPNKIYALGNTTEAGLRQDLKFDAVPVLFDEFETNGPACAERIKSVVDLARASWADSGASIIKGGSSGNASHFTVKFCGVFSSIRTRIINDADKGRILELELAPHGSNPEHWKTLEIMLSGIDEEFCERLFSRTIKMIPVLLANFKLMKKALARRVNSRFGDQYGMILAGYATLICDEPIDALYAETLAERFKLTEEKAMAGVTDHDDCLTHLLTTKVTIDRSDFSIGELIEIVHRTTKAGGTIEYDMAQGDNFRKSLRRLGIEVKLDCIAIVASNHAELERAVWKSEKWSKTWGNSLARLEGAIKKPVRFGSNTHRAILLPVKFFGLE